VHFYNEWTEADMYKAIALVLLLTSVLVTGCNTVAGMGKDIERGGEKTQDTARDVQRKM
jgi:entericidin B